MNTCCGYTLKVPHWGAFNKYQQHIFSCRNMLWVLIRSASTKKVLTDGRTDSRTDWRTDRSKMTQILTWPRSYPDKHQVWKFSVAKFSSYPSIKKCGQTDGRTDGPQMTHIQTFNSRLPEKYSSYCSTKKVWTDRQTDSLTDRWCDNYILQCGGSNYYA